MTVDSKIIEKIQKLLAHAEGTDNEAEAEAFIEKAQRLMQQHAIEQAMVEAFEATTIEQIVTLDILLPKKTPLTEAKRDLLNACATHNRCKMWFTVGGSRGSRASIAGYEGDAEYARLLYVHLLGQMELELAYAQADAGVRGGEIRTFKANFAQSYASRIWQRLSAMNEKIQPDVTTEEGKSQALMLVGRKAEVEKYVDIKVPGLTTHRRGASNYDAAARGAGRTAADAANIAGARGTTRRISS